MSKNEAKNKERSDMKQCQKKTNMYTYNLGNV